jgi:flagellar basal body-associated protein FliL
MQPGRRSPGSTGPGKPPPGKTGLGRTGSSRMQTGTVSAGSRPLGKPSGGLALPPSKSTAKKSKQRDEYTLAYAAGLIVVLLVVGFLVGWFYIKPTLQNRIETNVAFAKAGPFHIEATGYTYNASLAIQTDADNARRARKHQEALNELLYRTLLETDPKILSTPAGLAATQQTLTRKINETLDKPRVQQILFTDFVLQAD